MNEEMRENSDDSEYLKNDHENQNKIQNVNQKLENTNFHYYYYFSSASDSIVS